MPCNEEDMHFSSHAVVLFPSHISSSPPHRYLKKSKSRYSFQRWDPAYEIWMYKKAAWQLQVIILWTVRERLICFLYPSLPPLSSFHASKQGWCDEGCVRGHRFQNRFGKRSSPHVELIQHSSSLQGESFPKTPTPWRVHLGHFI